MTAIYLKALHKNYRPATVNIYYGILLPYFSLCWDEFTLVSAGGTPKTFQDVAQGDKPDVFCEFRRDDKV